MSSTLGLRESNPIIENFFNFLRHPEPQHQEILAEMVLVKNRHTVEELMESYEKGEYRMLAEFSSQSVIFLIDVLKKGVENEVNSRVSSRQ